MTAYCVIIGTGTLAAARLSTLLSMGASWNAPFTPNSSGAYCIILGTGGRATEDQMRAALNPLVASWSEAGASSMECEDPSYCC